MLTNVNLFSEKHKELLYEQYVKELRLRGYSIATIRSYTRHVRRFLESSLPVRDFILTYDNHARSTIRLIYFALERFHRFVLGEDLWAAVPIAKRQKRMPRILSREDVLRMITAAQKDPKVSSIIKFFYYAGLRLGELSSLTWENIDFNRKVINILKSKGARDRVVFLHPKIEKTLLDYCPIEDERKGHIFKSPRSGGPYSPKTIQLKIKNLANEAGISQKVCPHMLRHSFAVHLIDGGANIFDVKEVMGHKQVRTTFKYMKLSTRGFEKMVAIL